MAQLQSLQTFLFMLVLQWVSVREWELIVDISSWLHLSIHPTERATEIYELAACNLTAANCLKPSQIETSMTKTNPMQLSQAQRAEISKERMLPLNYMNWAQV